MPSHPKASLLDRVRRRPGLFALLAIAGVAGLAVVLFWFQPQALFFDVVVDEDLPAAGATPTTIAVAPTTVPSSEGTVTADDEQPTTTTDGPAGPQLVAQGTFDSRSRYTVTGTAAVYVLEDGSRVLRLEDFSSTNGPDLFVYLTASDSADPDTELNADFVNLGALKGNIGNQNYDIADDIALDHYDTVVIWCRRFTVGFGAADLAPVG